VTAQMEVINKVFQHKNKKHLLKYEVPEVPSPEPPKIDEEQIKEVKKAKEIVEELQEQ